MNLTLVQVHRIFKSIMKYSDNPIVQQILNESLIDDNNEVPEQDPTRTEDHQTNPKNHQRSSMIV
jgi:hypothetical protein